MNMISQLRARISQSGKTEITVDEYNQLQSEWITRAGADELIAAEGLTVIRTVLRVFDTVGNPEQFRAALVAAVEKMEKALLVSTTH